VEVLCTLAGWILYGEKHAVPTPLTSHQFRRTGRLPGRGGVRYVIDQIDVRKAKWSVVQVVSSAHVGWVGGGGSAVSRGLRVNLKARRR
jgi:hypothetical protein